MSALPDLRPTLDPTHLAVARWPAGWRPGTLPDGFFGLVGDEAEVTLVCAEAVAVLRGEEPPPVRSGTTNP